MSKGSYQAISFFLPPFFIHSMEQKIKIPKTDREILFLSVKVQEETAQRVDVLEEKVSSLEKSTTIDSSQQNILEVNTSLKIKEYNSQLSMNLDA